MNHMELFEESEINVKSPRLLWLEKHDIHTKHRTDLHKEDGECGEWEAYVGDYKTAVENMLEWPDGYPDASPYMGWGETEQEAIDILTQNLGIEIQPN